MNTKGFLANLATPTHKSTGANSACNIVDYKKHFVDQSEAHLPASGSTELVFLEGRRNGPAFGADAYVLDAQGKVVGGSFPGNTLPSDPTKYATVASGAHDFCGGPHKGKPAMQLDDRVNGVNRSVSTEGQNPRYPERGDPGYATTVNTHPGSSNNVSQKDRWSEGCLTIQGDHWTGYYDAYKAADYDALIKGCGHVRIERDIDEVIKK